MAKYTKDDVRCVVNALRKSTDGRGAALLTGPRLSRRHVMLGGLAMTAAGGDANGQERFIRWPTTTGRPPKCLQYPSPECEGLFARFSIGSREFKIPGPYVGVFEPIPDVVYKQQGGGKLMFLYPSGNSIRAENWVNAAFEVPEEEKTVVHVGRWQYLDEYTGRWRVPPVEEVQINITTSQPVKGDRGQPDGKGGFRHLCTATVFDHSRGVHATLDFDYRYVSEVKDIWNMFLRIEAAARVS